MPSEASPIVLMHTPHVELEVLYCKVFGVRSWCEKMAFLKPAPHDYDLMKSFVAAWLVTQVLDVSTPWNMAYSALAAPGTMWYQVQSLLRRQGIELRHVVEKASYQHFEDPVFDGQLSEHAKSLTNKMSMALLPHISGFSKRRQIQTTWRTRAHTAVKAALLLRAKMEATPGLRYKWLWAQSGSAIIHEEMKVVYDCQSPETSVVGLTIWPGTRIGEGNHGVERAADVLHSERWEGCEQ